MMYAQVITDLSNEELTELFDSSAPYIHRGNVRLPTRFVNGIYYILDMMLKPALQANLGRQLSDPDFTVFTLRETGTDKLLHLQTGKLEDGTFKTQISLFAPDSTGSLSWAYAPPEDSVVESLMANTGISRILMYPHGDNMENFIIAMGGIRVSNTSSGDKTYRTSWGWADYETDLVDM